MNAGSVHPTARLLSTKPDWPFRIHAVSRGSGCIRKTGPISTAKPCRGLGAPACRQGSPYPQRELTNRGPPERTPPGLYTTGRTPCGDKPERTTPSRSPFGARMQWPEPAHTEQSLARHARPTKGGAVRIRIALATAVAVLVIPAVLFTFLSNSSPVASARPGHAAASRHVAGSRHRAVRIDMKLMSYAAAQKLAKVATFYNAVTTQEEANYFKEITFLKALAAQQAAAAAAQQASAAAAAAAEAALDLGAGPNRWRLGRHEHEHARLGLHPTTRIRRQLHRGWRRRLPVRAWHVGGPDRSQHAG